MPVILIKMEKNAQLKIQQMIFMLVAVTLFFILVFLFYLSIKFSSLQQDKADLEREKAMGLVTKIASNPEFSFKGKSRAVDGDKLMVLKNSREYRNLWGVKDIIVEKIYPEAGEDECNIETYPDCKKIIVLGDGKGKFVQSYVALCRTENMFGNPQDKCELAILSIGAETE